MKYCVSIICILLLFSCKESVNPKTVKTYPNGNPQIISYYDENNQLLKQEFFYASGAIKIVGFYNDSEQKTGHWKSYYENGKLWSHNEYLNGKQHGISEGFFKDGTLKYHGHYKEDKKAGEWCIYVKMGNTIDKKCSLID